MAVAAIHAELIHVEGVIKGNGLGGLVSHPGVFGSEVVGHSGNDASHHDRQADKNLDGQPVGGAGKNIGHVLKREWIKWDNNRKGNLMFRLGLKLEISGGVFKKALEVLRTWGVSLVFLTYEFPL
jgi:hypothetical protein